MGWILGLLTTYTHSLELHVTTALSLIYILQFIFQPAVYSTNRSLEMAFMVEIPQLPVLTSLLSGEYPVLVTSHFSSQRPLQNSTAN
jgi:hypothetical protein